MLGVVQNGFTVVFKPMVALLQLLKKLSRVLYNIMVLFIPWEVRIKKIESESFAPIMNEVIVYLIMAKMFPFIHADMP